MEKNNFKRMWMGFWQLADPKIWVASTIPMAVGGALAYSRTGMFSLYWFVVALVGIYLIEIGKNAINEFIDYNSGVDKYVTPDKRTPFSGGKKTIVDGKLTVLETKIIALLTMGAAGCIGMYIVFFREFSVLWVGAAGFFFSVFYSMPPFKLAYKGLGEIVVGFTFGPLVLSGIYLVMAKTVDIYVLIVSLPIAFLIANVLWINQYPDYEADKKGGKKNWVVRMGKKKALKVYTFLFSAAYASMVLICILFRNPFWLLGLVSLPFASQAVRAAQIHYEDIQKLTEANMKTILAYQITGLTMVIASVASIII